MTRRFPRRTLVLLLLSGLAASAVDAVRAEVYARPVEGRVRTLVSGYLRITDGVDPIPQCFWQPFRVEEGEFILNPAGASRPDGRPDIFFREADGVPVVVWAIQEADGGLPGVGHDIAYATWTGHGWSATQVLSHTAENEVDPRVFVEADGASHVVWWVDEPNPRILMQTRGVGSDIWAATIQISPFGEPAFRPSVAVLDGTVRVAYERENMLDPYKDTELIVRRRAENGIWVEEVVLSSGWGGPLGALLHVKDGHLWVDWRDSASAFAYAELTDEGWTEPILVDWDDDTWVGVEMVRHLIESRVTKRRRREVDPDDASSTH